MNGVITDRPESSIASLKANFQTGVKHHATGGWDNHLGVELTGAALPLPLRRHCTS